MKHKKNNNYGINNSDNNKLNNMKIIRRSFGALYHGTLLPVKLYQLLQCYL